MFPIEVLDNLKKACEESIKELKKLDEIKRQYEHLEKTKAKCIDEITVLEKRKTEVNAEILNSRNSLDAEIKARHAELDQRELAIAERSKVVATELVQAQAMKAKVESEWSNVTSAKAEAEENARKYDEKIKQLKSIAAV